MSTQPDTANAGVGSSAAPDASAPLIAPAPVEGTSDVVSTPSTIPISSAPSAAPVPDSVKVTSTTSSTQSTTAVPSAPSDTSTPNATETTGSSANAALANSGALPLTTPATPAADSGNPNPVGSASTQETITTVSSAPTAPSAPSPSSGGAPPSGLEATVAPVAPSTSALVSAAPADPSQPPAPILCPAPPSLGGARSSGPAPSSTTVPVSTSPAVTDSTNSNHTTAGAQSPSNVATAPTSATIASTVPVPTATPGTGSANTNETAVGTAASTTPSSTLVSADTSSEISNATAAGISPIAAPPVSTISTAPVASSATSQAPTTTISASAANVGAVQVPAPVASSATSQAPTTTISASAANVGAVQVPAPVSSSATSQAPTTTTSTPAANIGAVQAQKLAASGSIPQPSGMQATLKANATGTQATVSVTPADIQGLTCAINIPEEDIHKPMNMEKFICGLGAQPRWQARALGQRLGQFWENGSTITYSFIGGTSNQQSKVSLIVGLAFVFIGVTIQEVDPGQDAMIRISFDPTLGSWSYVGKANLKVRAPKATMNLASITDSPNQASSDWVLVLHEFCHVLGLVHDTAHMSDIKGPTTEAPNDAAVYSYYSNTLGWNREIIKHQILNVYDSGSVSNYATPDSDSIMQYFMPAALDTQNVESAMPDTTLSTFDTSFLTLIYPRPQNPNGVIQACPTFGLDDTTTQNINNAYTAGNVIRMRAIVNAVLLAQRATPLLAREAR